METNAPLWGTLRCGSLGALLCMWLVSALAAQSGHIQSARPDSIRAVELFSDQFNNHRTPVERVLKGSAELDSVWSRMFPSGASPRQQPLVNFDTSMLLFIALGGRPSTHFYIVLDSIRRVDSALAVYYRERAPGRGCVVGTADTQPLRIFLVPRVNAQVRFVKATERLDCE